MIWSASIPESLNSPLHPAHKVMRLLFPAASFILTRYDLLSDSAMSLNWAGWRQQVLPSSSDAAKPMDLNAEEAA